MPDSTKTIVPPETVLAIRACKTAHPAWGGMMVKRDLNLPYSPQYIGRIMYNQALIDPNYTPVPPGSALCGNSKAKAWSDSRNTQNTGRKRKPSIECACLCPTCGFGYDTMREALDCCKRVKEA
jgi:hypothetical protein